MGVFRFRWRRESPLDIYNLALGAFLFLSPWLLALAYPAARIDAWVCETFTSWQIWTASCRRYVPSLW